MHDDVGSESKYTGLITPDFPYQVDYTIEWFPVADKTSLAPQCWHAAERFSPVLPILLLI